MDAISTVKVGSQAIAWPGAYSQSDTSAAQVPALASRGTVALIGPAPNGKPGVVHEFMSLDALRKTFWLADADGVFGMRLAAQYLYGASADPQITGGPTRVLVVKTNADTTGTGVLQGALGALIDLKSRDYGAHVNNIRVSVSTGKLGGVTLSIKEGAIVEVGDSLGSVKALDLKFTGLSTLSSVLATVDANGLAVAYTGAIPGELGDEIAVNWGGGVASVATVTSNSAADNYQKVTVYGLDGNSPISETIALNGVANVAGLVSFTKVTGARLDGLCVGTVLVKDAVPATSASFAASLLAAPAAGVLKVVSAAAADVSLPVQLTGYDANGSLLVETLVLNGTTTVTGVGTFAKLLKVAITGTTAGNVTVKDSGNVSIVTLLAGLNPSAGFAAIKGLTALQTLPQAGTLTLTAAGGAMDLVLRGTDSTGAAVAVRVAANVGVPTTPATVWSLISQVEMGNTGTAVTVTVAGTVLKATPASTVAAAVAAAVNSGVFATNSYNDARLVSGLDYVAQVACKSPAVASLFSATADVVDWINSNSELVSATRVVGASGLPIVTAVPVAIVGGTTAASTVGNYETALELLKDWPECNALWVNTTDAAVQALALSHVKWAEERAERFAFLGLPSNQTIEQIDAASVGLNHQQVVMCAQDDVDYDEAGVLRTWSPLVQALKAMGMFVAAAVGESLTRKYISTKGQANSKWAPLRDGEALLRRGLLFSVFVKGRGTRWVRGLTTYRKSYNSVYTEISAMDSYAASKRDLREFLDELVTGQDTVSLPLDAIRRDGEARLLAQRVGGMITNFANALATETGDLVTFDYDCGPRMPRNFTLLRAHVAVALQKAQA